MSDCMTIHYERMDGERRNAKITTLEDRGDILVLHCVDGRRVYLKVDYLVEWTVKT